MIDSFRFVLPSDGQLGNYCPKIEKVAKGVMQSVGPTLPYYPIKQFWRYLAPVPSDVSDHKKSQRKR